MIFSDITILYSQASKLRFLRYLKGDKRSYKLTEEDVVFLASHTNYTKEEIREWFRLTVNSKQQKPIVLNCSQ